MKTNILTLFAILCAAVVQAQITSISTYSSGGGLGPVTTIAPLGNGYSYSTIGGPNGGNWGSVQVTGGNVTGVAVGPRGGTYPIVTPAQPVPQPQSILGSPIIPTASVPVPEYIPMPMPASPRSTAPEPKVEYPKSFWDWTKSQGIFTKGEMVMTGIAEETFLTWVDTFEVTGPVDLKTKNKSGLVPKSFSEWLTKNHILEENKNYHTDTLIRVYGIWLKKALAANQKSVAKAVSSNS